MRKVLILSLVLLLTGWSVHAQFAFAPPGGGGGAGGGGGLPTLPTRVGDVMNRVVGFIALIVLILAVFMFIYAGYLMVTSGGDAGKVEAAKSYLVYGAVGMGIAFVAWALIRLIGAAFGVQW